MHSEVFSHMQSHRRRLVWLLGALSALGLGAALRLPRASAGDADTADVPPGTVAFFGSPDSRCPNGWRTLQDASGRLLVGATAQEAVGGLVGKPLADQEDRTHQHAYSATVELPYKSISAADGPNRQGAAAQKYTTQGQSEPSTSGLPFVQLTLCEKW
jgi:hypothetical protein